MRQRTNLDILEGCRIAMILEADDTFAGQAVFGSMSPFAAALLLEPIVGPGFELQNLLTIKPVLYMAIVEDNLRSVPLAHRIDMHLGVIGQMHSIVHTQFLPFFEFLRSIHFLPTLVVNELILRTRHIGNRESGILHYMINHSTITAMSQLPVPCEFEVGKLALCNDVAGIVCTFTTGLDTTIHGLPSVGQDSVVKITPLGEILAVEQQNPTFFFFIFCQHIVFGLTRTEDSTHYC